MDYSKYVRTFVMMEEQTSDFSIGKAPAKGYLKVETGNNKGALRCVVQNLKYFSRGEYIYKLILFGRKQGRVLSAVMGSLAINRNGNGETYFRFNPLNIDEKGSEYGDFSMAVVTAASRTSNEEALRPVLKGIMKKDEPEEELSENVENVEDVEDVEIKPRTNYNSFYNEYLLRFCDFTCKSANLYEDIFPFEKDKTNARWKRIQNISSLPLVSPGAHLFASQYKHFLFGARPDSEGVASHYYFAVPGRFIQEEQPDGGRSGFVLWQPFANGSAQTQAGNDENSNYGYGYWIVAIDALTGDIIEAT